MKELLQSGAITEIKGSQNVAYILNDDELFLLTGYKMLKSQEKNGFIKCAKVRYNGKIKLLYFSSTYKNLASLIPTIDGDTFLSIVTNLLGSIIEIKNNGFMSCQNLDLSLNKIFVDLKTLSVSLVYLPINTPPIDMGTFENDLRTQLIKIITSTPSLSNVNAVCAELSNGTLSLTDLHQNIKLICNGDSGSGNSRRNSGRKAEKVEVYGGQKTLIISAMNTPIPVQFNINKSEFVMGKNSASVDGAITFNKAISRIHCKTVFQNGKYYIVDLGSANGTYLNKKKLVPYQQIELRDGDIIRMANSDFAVRI